MRSSKLFAVAVISSLAAVAAQAARLDLNDPKRAVGREDNIRIDAQLNDDTLSPSYPVSVTYQIENLTNAPVAIADKVASADYDPESNTITLSIGAEVPSGASMPHLVAIRPGEKKVLTASSFAHIPMPSVRTPWTSVPRFVSIKVSVLRDLNTFGHLLEKQSAGEPSQPFPNDLFDRWVEGSESVYLNVIPIRWKQDNRLGTAESNRPSGVGGTF
jgi:hypothetical protein